jgi:Beta-propeller repeat
MKKSIIICFLITLFYASIQSKIYAQNEHTTHNLSDGVQTAWVKHYTMEDFSLASVAIAVDRTGNVYVTGDRSCCGDVITLQDFVTIKYNSNGYEQWVAIYDSPAKLTDGAVAIALDGSGNVYVTGYSFSYTTRTDYATVKYDSNGTELWSVLYNGPNNSTDRARGLVVDDAGNVYVTGISWDSPGSHDYVTIKYNTDGVELWVARYNGPADYTEQATDIAIDDSGNVYVTGYSTGIGTAWDFATIKYNSNGVEQWVARNIDGGGSTLIAVDDSGNVYVAGSGNGYLTVKYNSNGIEQWFARYSSANYPRDLAVDNSGNVFVTGEGRGGSPGKEYATVKYNTNGFEQWVAHYTGPGFGGFATSLAVSESGNVYVTGLNGGVGTDSDYATLKYNSEGIEQWVARYNGSENLYDGALSLAIDDSENVYVTGFSYIDQYCSEYVTIKYIQSTPVSVKEEEIKKPGSYLLSQNYPNPFNPGTVISYELKGTAFVILKLYDLMGKDVMTLVNEKQTGGSYQVVWNGRNKYGKEVSSGIYFYRLKTDAFSQTRKMILIR